METAAGGPVHGELPPEPGFSSTLISLVVLRNAEGRFASTHERDGWYLPAGRVDAGEGFATGAVREALEEAGVPVKLTGILRIEHTPAMRGSRMRVIYAAEPVDDTPLKSVPDHEIIEAKWLNIDELQGLKLRSREVKSIFTWAQAGTRLFPTSLLESEDSNVVDHTKVQVNLVTVVEAVVTDDQGRYLAVKDEKGRLNIPSAVLTRPRQFKLAAVELVPGVTLKLDGVLKVYYFAANSPSNPNPTGFAKVVYLASVASGPKDGVEGAQWLTAQEWAELSSMPSNDQGAAPALANANCAHVVALAHSTPRDQIAPVDVIAMEYDSLKVFS